MKTRLLSALVGIPFAIGLIILGGYYSIVIDLSLSLIASMCIFEGLSAKGLNKKFTIVIPCMAFTFAICMFYSYWVYLAPILVFVLFMALFMAMIFNHEHLEFPDISFALTMTALCTFGFWSIIYLYDMFKSPVGLFYIVTGLATPWLADGGAYFGGSFLGKTKLCPKISPKKTVEGAVSGVIIGALLSLLVGIIFEAFIFQNAVVNYIYLATFGLLGALVSIVGDLSFSLVKRSCGIKDYGSLIPGHGGMLDRFDSVIFTSPLLLIFNMFLPIVTIVGEK